MSRYSFYFLCVVYTLVSFPVFSETKAEANLNCDLIIFSYDRPMQLYALLESREKHVFNLRKTAVLARATSSFFRDQYEEVNKRFQNVDFIYQSNSNPQNDFKPLLLDLIFGHYGKGASFVMFAVDDIIITGDINIEEDLETLIETDAYGLFYRLGKSVNFSYMSKTLSPNPVFTYTGNHMLLWDINQATGVWAYKNTVHFTIYRKNDIKAAFRKLNYANPNDLEGRWVSQYKNRPRDKGLCTEYPKLINNVVNTITAFRGRSKGELSVDHLAELFEEGLKIDISQFSGRKNSSPHIYEEYSFIKR